MARVRSAKKNPKRARRGFGTGRRRNSSDRQKRIWFERLPDLVKCKILRQYVPVLDKIRTLPALPEFSRQLRIRWSWMNASDAFADVVSILPALREGFYVASKDLPDHGYHVSSGTSGKTIAFTLFSMTDKMHAWRDYRWDTFGVYEPASNFRDFLNSFLKNYCPIETKPVLAYLVDGEFDVFVNRAAGIAMWVTGDMHPIESNRCVMTTKFSRVRKCFSLRDDDRMEFEWGADKQTVEPASLKSHLLKKRNACPELLRKGHWNDGPVPVDRKVCRFEFSLDGRESISVRVLTPNPLICSSIVKTYKNKKLWNTFSERVLENISHQEKKLLVGLKERDWIG